MSEADSKTYKGHEIVIKYDESPQDPRTEWDNLTELHVLADSRYYLGEKQHADREDIDAEVAAANKAGDMVLKLYAYIHSGVALSLESFYGKLPQGHAEYDSAQCGVVIIRRKDILENFGIKRITKDIKERVYKIAESDIKTFTQYLNGEVYGYIIDDHKDSCWGYYSIEDAMGEAKDIIDWIVKEDKTKHFDNLKTWIKNKVPLYARTTLGQAIEV